MLSFSSTGYIDCLHKPFEIKTTVSCIEIRFHGELYKAMKKKIFNQFDKPFQKFDYIFYEILNCPKRK